MEPTSQMLMEIRRLLLIVELHLRIRCSSRQHVSYVLVRAVATAAISLLEQVSFVTSQKSGQSTNR